MENNEINSVIFHFISNGANEDASRMPQLEGRPRVLVHLQRQGGCAVEARADARGEVPVLLRHLLRACVGSSSELTLCKLLGTFGLEGPARGGPLVM